MNKILKSNVFGTILMIPFFISMFLLDIFWGWLVFSCYFLIIGIYIILLLIFGDMKNVKNRLVKALMKGSMLLVAIGLIYFFYLWGLPSIKDISNKINNNYEFIVGVPIKTYEINTRNRFPIWQNIEISEVKLKNMNPITPIELEKTMLIQYLPNSKYVIHITVSKS